MSSTGHPTPTSAPTPASMPTPGSTISPNQCTTSSTTMDRHLAATHQRLRSARDEVRIKEDSLKGYQVGENRYCEVIDDLLFQRNEALQALEESKAELARTKEALANSEVSLAACRIRSRQRIRNVVDLDDHLVFELQPALVKSEASLAASKDAHAETYFRLVDTEIRLSRTFRRGVEQWDEIRGLRAALAESKKREEQLQEQIAYEQRSHCVNVTARVAEARQQVTEAQTKLEESLKTQEEQADQIALLVEWHTRDKTREKNEGMMREENSGMKCVKLASHWVAEVEVLEKQKEELLEEVGRLSVAEVDRTRLRRQNLQLRDRLRDIQLQNMWILSGSDEEVEEENEEENDDDEEHEEDTDDDGDNDDTDDEEGDEEATHSSFSFESIQPASPVDIDGGLGTRTVSFAPNC